MVSTEPVLTRDIRQRELIPPQKMASCHAIVIGVGAIGRQVALQLAAIGMPSIELFDHDVGGIEISLLRRTGRTTWAARR